jgi:radical SAM protein with 4Fe4S-binding SPASM domain
VELVGHCKKNGLKVTLNTNGILMNEILAQRLADAGLDYCVLSMYSHIPNHHDNMKGVPGVHTKAVSAVKQIFGNGISAKFLNVLTSENLFDLPGLIRWAILSGVSELSLSYLEGGEKAYLPTVEDMDGFCSEIVPQCVDVIDEFLSENEKLRDRNQNAVKGLFRFPDVSWNEIAQGLYQPKQYRGCGRSRSFALVLANGDVHPCNAVEYFHEPVAGNLFRSKLQDIWESEVYNRVRENGAGWCRRCPMGRHSTLVFKDSEAVAELSYKERMFKAFKRLNWLKK